MNHCIKIKQLSKLNEFRSSKENYRVFWFPNSVDSMRIEGQKVSDFPNLIVFIVPGKDVTIECNGISCGWVLEFSQNYFDLLGFEPLVIKNAILYYSLGQIPKIALSPKIGLRIQSMFEMIDEMAGSNIPNKEYGMFSLLKTILIYCDSKCNINLEKGKSNQELITVLQYKELVSQYYTNRHLVSDYAGELHISSKYLNQLVKKVMGVTAKHLIKEQLIMHACRDLKFSAKSVKEIALNLGFAEPYHFSRFFKNYTGLAPNDFRAAS